MQIMYKVVVKKIINIITNSSDFKFQIRYKDCLEKYGNNFD